MEYSKEDGPTGDPRCPKCRNSLQNIIVSRDASATWAPDAIESVYCCAECKTHFKSFCPIIGGVYRLNSTLMVDWLVVSRRFDSPFALVVPVDRPVVLGTTDVAIDGSLVAVCGLALWVNESRFKPRYFTRNVDAGVVDSILSVIGTCRVQQGGRAAISPANQRSYFDRVRLMLESIDILQK